MVEYPLINRFNLKNYMSAGTGNLLEVKKFMKELKDFGFRQMFIVERLRPGSGFYEVLVPEGEYRKMLSKMRRSNVGESPDLIHAV